MRYLIFAGRENERLQEGDKLISPGDEFEVTEERADQLLADPNVVVFAAPDDDLQRLSRPKLDELAAEAGLDPKQYPNKDALIDALTNPPAATGEGQDQNTPPEV